MPPRLRFTQRQTLWIGLSLLFLSIVTLAWFWQKRASTPPTQAPTIILSNPDDLSGIVKITLSAQGMYKLESSDLRKLGLSPTNPADLRLTNLGQPHPLWFSEQGTDFTLYFYGVPLDNRYTHQNIYFLSTDKSELPAPDPILEPPLPTLALHLEENELYFPKAEADHTWFWKNLNAPKTENMPFTVTHPADGSGNLRLQVYASTESPHANPDHHLRVSLNGTHIADQTWDGRGGQLLEFPFETTLLKDGENTLTLELPGLEGVLVESLLLDWFEIAYPRQLKAEQDRLTFLAPAKEVELTGFSPPFWAFDLTAAGLGNSAPDVVLPQTTTRFPTEPDHLYFAAGENGFLTPDSLSPAQTTPDLRAPTLQADYLALGPPDLLQPLQPLLEYRETQGLTTLSIPVEAIYDQFGHGLPHPQAIRNFLQFAAQTWETPPTYVVLVGDSTYDPAGYQTPSEANRVPSFFRFTYFGGETVTDVQIAQLDDDQLPDLALGRIPAQTIEQVKIIVEKTLAYEQNPPDTPWNKRILAIADGQEASFKGDAETFLAQFSEAYTPVLYAPEKGASTAPQEIETYLNEGVLFMSYFGHGSIAMLGKDRIFSNEDGAGLKNNERLPIMINITCLAGLFTHPEVESLTETMLWNPNGGAVAALSATSLTTPGDQQHLSKALIAALLQSPNASLGEILLLAQRALPLENTGAREVMDTFLLFGDPALNLPLP